LTITSIKVTMQTVTSFFHAPVHAGNTCIAKKKKKNLIFTGKNYSNLWM